MRRLDDKPYDRKESQSCLNLILSHPEIQKGKLILRHYKIEDSLTFRVESPSLSVSDLEWGVSGGDLAAFHELLSVNGRALRSGEPYDSRRDDNSRLVLDLLLRSQGRQAGITRDVYLDYNNRTARVVFKIWDGPPRVPQSLVPPYAEPCKIMNGFFNWTDADDLTPIHFVEQLMKTRWLGCYSEADVREDSIALKELKFLKEASISADGPGNMRSISVHLRSNPIPISHVEIRGYGLLEGHLETDIPPLTVHPGDIYSRRTVWQEERFLRESFAKDGRQVQVFSDVSVDSTGKATVSFAVLAYPDDMVYVNGAPYDGTFHK